MSENTGNNTAEAGEQQPNQEQAESTFSQEDVNRIVQERLQREREKYADYDDLKTAAEQLSEIQSERDELATKVSEFEAKEQHRKLVNDVAETTGVPAVALKGETKEELEAHAEVLKGFLQNTTGPVIPGQEKRPQKVEESEERKAARQLFGN